MLEGAGGLVELVEEAGGGLVDKERPGGRVEGNATEVGEKDSSHSLMEYRCGFSARNLLSSYGGRPSDNP